MANIPQPHCFYKSSGRDRLNFVQPVLGSIHLVVAEEAQMHPRRQHRSYQVVFAERGHYRCMLNAAPLVLQPTDLLIVKRGDWHEEMVAAGLRYHAVNFDLAGTDDARVGDILFRAGIEPGQQVIQGPNPEIWGILGRMQGEGERDDPFVPHIENALLAQLFWWLVRSLPRECLSPIFLQPSAVQAFSDRLRRLFEDRLAENLTADAIADELGVSVRTLTKRCREVIGRPPARAFLHHKMEYAAHALRQSDVPIKEISHRLGFQNQYHFSRVFRRCLGTPPSTYRDVPK